MVSEDRISELPDALIVQILSLLPTEKAIATSVLSKQWKSFWKMVPNLKFDSCSHKLELENICRYLLSHKAPVLQSLHLKVGLDECLDSEILILETEILIGIAFARNLRELVLRGQYGDEKRLKLPKSLYSCETLKTLKLWNSVLIDVVHPSSVRLKSLTTLDLYYVEFKDDESLVNLLSGCPNLENLVLHGISYDKSVKTITIAVPTLQRLSIYNNGYEMRTCWVINTPSLKYLTITGTYTLNYCQIENVSELVWAYLIDVSSEIYNEKLMKTITSAKRLYLCLLPFKNKFPTGNVFYQLIYLEVLTYEPAEWGNLLTLMLGSSPKLQVLKLNGRVSWEYLPERCKWNQPKTVPECFLSHLETFMWKAYKWNHEYERQVAKYILKNTNCLKRATFSFENMSSEDSLVVANDLKSVVKADNSCQFQFKPYIE